MNIEINMDSVTIEGQVVKRPDFFGRGQWVDWWEKTLAINKRYCYYCGMTAKK